MCAPWVGLGCADRALGGGEEANRSWRGDDGQTTHAGWEGTGQVVYGQQPRNYIRPRKPSELRVWGEPEEMSDRSEVLWEYLSRNKGRQGACSCLETGLEGRRPVGLLSPWDGAPLRCFPFLLSFITYWNKHTVISPNLERKQTLAFSTCPFSCCLIFMIYTCTPWKEVSLFTVCCFPRFIVSWTPASLSSPHCTETTRVHQKDGATADLLLGGQERQRRPCVFSPLILTVSPFSSLIFTLSMTFSTPHCTAQAQTQAQAIVTSCWDWQSPPHWSFLFFQSLLPCRSLTGLLQMEIRTCNSSGQSCRWLPMALRIEAKVHFSGLEALHDVVSVFLSKPHSNHSPLTHFSPALISCSSSGQTCPRTFALASSFTWKAHSSDFNMIFFKCYFLSEFFLDYPIKYHPLPLSNRMFCDDGVVLYLQCLVW